VTKWDPQKLSPGGRVAGHGKAPILIGGSDTDAEPFINQGLPIHIVNPAPTASARGSLWLLALR
jgi:hypothetical protein